MSEDTEEDIFTYSGNLFHNYGDYGRYKVMVHIVSLCKRCNEVMKLIVLVRLNGRNYFVQNIRRVVHVTINNN